MFVNKVYFYGLFYDKTKSVNDFLTAVSRRQEYVFYFTDSQENILKLNKSEIRVIFFENRRLREMIQDKIGYGFFLFLRYSFFDLILGRYFVFFLTGF